MQIDVDSIRPSASIGSRFCAAGFSRFRPSSSRARSAGSRSSSPSSAGGTLATAQVPREWNLGVACLRYSAQTYAYALLVTGRYPYAAPVLREKKPEPEPMSVVDPTAAVPGDTF